MTSRSRSSGGEETPHLSVLEQITPLARATNCLEIDRIAQVCIENIRSLVRARLASLYVLDEGNSILHLVRHNHPFLINKIVSLNQNRPSVMVMAVKSKSLLCIDCIDTHREPVIKKSCRPFARNYQTGNCVISPLLCQDNVVGVLNFADKPGAFNRQDVALIDLFSQLVGASVGNIKLFERIQRQAATDGLTGLSNHRTFYELLEKELWRSRRYGGQISLIMIDIDNLKTINDTYGHRAGDLVIKSISKTISGCIRQIDTAARYGGDEFAVILPNTSLKDTVVVARRMVDAVAASKVVWNNRSVELSISVGVGRYDAIHSPEDITHRSDKALYTAKQAGKNTVKVFEPAADD